MTQMVPAGADSMDRVKAAGASKLMAVVPPYLVMLLVGGVGSCFHALFGYGAGVPWAVMGETIGTMVLTGVTWGVSHQRGDWGRIHTTATAFLVGMWVTAATVVGASHPVTGYFWLVGGLTIAASWNIRTVIRSKMAEAGISDPLSFLFNRDKDKAKLGSATMKTIEAGERKIDAEMSGFGGEKTVADLQKRTENIEGAMQLPPGTMTISPDMDRADMAKVTISDPRIMRSPIPWPGPSRPGESIAEPIRTGVFQDLEDVAHTIPGQHVQVMGMTGSGKSIGCAWNTLAEIVTRPDVAVFAIDLKKGEQSLGPLRKSLHRFETTEAGARALIDDMQAEAAGRTDYLASKGLVRWKQGCGLAYWVLYAEEAWRLFEVVDMEVFEDLMKAIRSAGGSVFYSLQRGDSTQVPTLIKGQVAHWCFGVANSHDAHWGLSKAQEDAGAEPEDWGDDQPGMSFLHARGVPREKIAMPLRTFNWAEDTAAIRAHCEQYPAAAKAVDEFTARIARLPAGGAPTVVKAQPSPDMGVDEEERELLLAAAELVVTSQLASTLMLTRKLRIGHVQAKRLMAELIRHEVVGPDRGDEGRAEVLATRESLDQVLAVLRAADPADDVRTPDPDPSITAGLDDEITDDPGEEEFTFARPAGGKASPEEARAALLEQIEEWRSGERERFATRDMRPLLDRTGMSRGWAQKQLKALVADGALRYDDEAQEFVIRAMAGASS
jgi:hypothetical protein